jgi:hypothetical protein
MTVPSTSNPLPPSLSPNQKDFLKIVYQEISEEKRHYDSHIWQIPSLTIPVNAFLIGQAFSIRTATENPILVRGLVTLGASLYTFVLLIALVKHRLHQCAQRTNAIKIEEKFLTLPIMKYYHHEYNLADKNELHIVEPDPNIIESVLAPMKAHTWLMSIMLLTLIIDLITLVGIVFGKW